MTDESVDIKVSVRLMLDDNIALVTTATGGSAGCAACELCLAQQG